MIKRQLLLFIASLALFGCASSKVTSLPVAREVSHPVRAIAMASKGGPVTEAIGLEFASKGFRVIDPDATASLLGRLGISASDIDKPEAMTKLRAEGIDAYFSIRGVTAKDGRPINASARINSLQNGKVLSAVSWENGWGGQAGSISDRTMRKGTSEAANEIATALTKDLNPQ